MTENTLSDASGENGKLVSNNGRYLVMPFRLILANSMAKVM